MVLDLHWREILQGLPIVFFTQAHYLGCIVPMIGKTTEQVLIPAPEHNRKGSLTQLENATAQIDYEW